MCSPDLGLRLSGAKHGSGAGGGVPLVDEDNLVVGARCEVTVVSREADGEDSARVVGERAELFGDLDVVLVKRLEDGVGGPDANVAVCLLSVSCEDCQFWNSDIPRPPVARRKESGETWRE